MTDDRPTIAFVIDDLSYGGAQRQLSLSIAALGSAVKSHVFCTSTRTHPFAAAIEAAGGTVHVLARSGPADLLRLAGLVRGIRHHDIAVIHGMLDASNVYAYLAGRATRRPVVLSLRSDRLALRGIRASALRRAIAHADRVVVNSVAGERFLLDELALARERTTLVPNIAPPPGQPRPRADGTPPVVGFVGRLAREKRVDVLLGAFARARSEVPDLRLEIIGDGPMRAGLEAAARRLGLGDGVAFTGSLDDPGARIAGMRCLALPSAFEGLPNAALEAMSVGIPVVAAAAGDLGTLVENGRTGVLVDPMGEASLARALVTASTDPELTRRARAEGPHRVAALHSPQAAADALLALYRDILD